MTFLEGMEPNMGQSGFDKHLRRWTRDFKGRKLGSTELSDKAEVAQTQAMIEDAIKSGKIPVKKGSTQKKKRPDMRKRPSGY